MPILKLFKELLSFHVSFYSDETGHIFLLLHLLLFIGVGVFISFFGFCTQGQNLVQSCININSR